MADIPQVVNSDKSKKFKGKQGSKVGPKQLWLTGFLVDLNVASGCMSHSLSHLDLHVQNLGEVQLGHTDFNPDLEQPILLTGTEWSDAVSELETAAGADVNVVKSPVTRWADKVAQHLSVNDVNKDKSGDSHDQAQAAGQVSHESIVAPDVSLTPSTVGQAVQHKAEVPLIFLAYKWVLAEGERISLVQIATSVIQAMHSDNSLDAVQPMKMGWHIYMHTLSDHTHLVERGIHVAGKFILLCSEVHAASQQFVKIALKDLPLHSVDNKDVLDSLKEVCKVNSTVKYSNL